MSLTPMQPETRECKGTLSRQTVADGLAIRRHSRATRVARVLLPNHRVSVARSAPYAQESYLLNLAQSLMNFFTSRRALCLLATLGSALGACGSTASTASNKDAGPRTLHTETVTFQDGVAPAPSYAGTRDTTLMQAIPTSAQGLATTLSVSGATGSNPDQAQVALVKWDTSLVAPGSQVTQASLDFYVTGDPQITNGIVARAAAAPWDESQADWLNASSSAPWAAPGARGTGDRDDTPLATLMPLAPGDYSVPLNDAGVAEVQNWIDHPSENEGLVLDADGDSEAFSFASRESLIPSSRPALTVTFTTNAPLPDAGPPISEAGTDASGEAGNDAGRSDAGDGGASPIPSPIQYIVVFIKENHTFDNYFEGFPGATTSATAKLSNGTVITRPKAPTGTLPRDICHSHSCAKKAFHGGKMDRFDLVSGANNNNDHLTFIHYTEGEIPNYWKYAKNFVLADHFFSSTFAQSFPGHFATVAGFNVALGNPGCSCGGSCTVPVYNPKTCAITNAHPCWNAPSVVLGLPPGFTWAEYGWHTLLSVKKVADLPGIGKHMRSKSDLVDDLTSGKQPNLVFAHLTGGTSEHPPQAVCPGENDTVTLINDIMHGPHWKQTAILLLWDDWGGFYDSVKPAATKCSNGDYMHPGFRLPLIIISPYAKQGYVLKTRTEQISVVRLIEDLWGLPRMEPEDSRIRDADVGSLMGAFDFTQSPRGTLILKTRTCP
jgi:phospholipase C